MRGPPSATATTPIPIAGHTADAWLCVETKPSQYPSDAAPQYAAATIAAHHSQPNRPDGASRLPATPRPSTSGSSQSSEALAISSSTNVGWARRQPHCERPRRTSCSCGHEPQSRAHARARASLAARKSLLGDMADELHRSGSWHVHGADDHVRLTDAAQAAAGFVEVGGDTGGSRNRQPTRSVARIRAGRGRPLEGIRAPRSRPRAERAPTSTAARARASPRLHRGTPCGRTRRRGI